ncbi:hypothetical protein D3C84_1209510 [compost metagenome]
MKTDFRFCLDTVEYGYFDPTIADRDAAKAQGMVDRQSPPESLQVAEQPPQIRAIGVKYQPEARTLQ